MFFIYIFALIAKSFYTVSKAALLEQVNLWRKHLGNVIPHYAVKSNTDSNLIRWLNETQYVNIDCASPNEMNICIDQGYRNRNIIYANTMKSYNDIRESIKYNCPITTVDSVEAVKQIYEVKEKWNPDILIRLAVDDTDSKSPFSIKFGATKEEWNNIYNTILYSGLKFKGLSFHIGSSSQNPDAFKKAIHTCRLFQQIINTHIDTIDIGGGFLPDKYTFKKTASVIQHEIHQWSMSTRHAPPKNWIAEPGRFFSAPTQTLYVPVVFSKENNSCIRYIIDDSLYGQFTNVIFDHAEPIWSIYDSYLKPINRKCSNKDAYFFGKTCDSMDFIAIQRNAPIYNIGDVLCFKNMGAYTNVTASTFNGFNIPNKIYIDNYNIDTGIKTDSSSIVFPISSHSTIPLSIHSK